MKMNMLKFLIASGLISLGAKRVYAESIKVPEEIEAVNIEEFQACLRAPHDSLTVEVRREEADIEMYEAAGDTSYLRYFKERTEQDSEREARIGEAVKSINSSTYGRFTNFNTAISDSLITSGEVGNLLSRVELDQKARDTYQKIAGHEAYAKVDEAVARFNADVDNLLARVSETRSEEVGRREAAEVPAPKAAEKPKTPEEKTLEEKEQDYTKMDRLSYEAGLGYNTDERLNLALGGFYNIDKEVGFGLTLEGRLPEKDSDSERNTLATQRNRITGTRLEAVEDRSKSARDYSLELLANGRFNPHENFSFRYGAGVGRKTTDRDSTLTVAETLYDRNDNVFGKPNVDSYEEDSSKNEWYVPALIGGEYIHSNIGVGVQVKRDASGKREAYEARGTLTYKF